MTYWQRFKLSKTELFWRPKWLQDDAIKAQISKHMIYYIGEFGQNQWRFKQMNSEHAIVSQYVRSLLWQNTYVAERPQQVAIQHAKCKGGPVELGLPSRSGWKLGSPGLLRSE